MSDTYELTEDKSLITAQNGITEDQLNEWKINNFGEGSIDIQTNSNLYLPQDTEINFNLTQNGYSPSSYNLTKKCGILILRGSAFNNTIVNRTDSAVRLVYFNNTSVLELKNIIINAGESTTITVNPGGAAFIFYSQS